MIKISGTVFPPYNLMDQYTEDSIEGKVLNQLSLSSEVYPYVSVNHLKFELNLRANIVSAAIDLYKSKISFKAFRKAKCNEKYWFLTNEGGFLLREGVKPSDAIEDIFVNGKLYGTECATAIVIIYYKAVLNVFPEELFNRYFPNIQLMNWHYIDRDLGVHYFDDVVDFLPGDCLYFKNPDVNPRTPEWQGENVIDLSNGTYYGHGMGIKTAEQIIHGLNRHREEEAEESAYLMSSSKRLDSHHLSTLYYNFMTETKMESYPQVSPYLTN